MDSEIKTVDLDELGREFDFFKIPRPTELANPATTAVQQQEESYVPFEGGTLLSDELIEKITEWLPQKKISLLYKATVDGFDAQDFHQKCDGLGRTLTVIQSGQGYLFGGCTKRSWGGNTFRTDPTAFLFTLTNPYSLPPTRYFIKPSHTHCAIRSNPAYSAAFGSGKDIFVATAPHQNKNSYSDFPVSYKDTTGKGNLTFTGTRTFQIDDVEVYSIHSASHWGIE